MKTGDALDTRSVTVDHKMRVKNLQERQKNERINLENMHKVNMSKQRVNNSSQIENLKLQHNQKLLDENLKHEAKLMQMKNSLEKVKTHTEKEITDLKQDNELKKEGEKQIFETNYTSSKDKHQMLLQDLDQEANIEIQKLQRRAKIKEEEITRMHDQEKKFMKNNHLTTINMKKEEYAQQKLNEDGKFSKNLTEQKKIHTKKLAQNETAHQTKVINQKQLYDKQTQAVQKYGVARKAEMQSRYENKFEQVFKNEEEKLQHLQKNKENILNKLKSQFKKDLKLALEKDKDPFYNRVSLEPKLSEIENGYEVSIEVPHYDADKVQLTGKNRTLKLTMDRNYEFNSEEDGQTKTIKKAETLVSKLPVEDIIEPKSISRRYLDGVLTFKIEKA